MWPASRVGVSPELQNDSHSAARLEHSSALPPAPARRHRLPRPSSSSLPAQVAAMVAQSSGGAELVSSAWLLLELAVSGAVVGGAAASGPASSISACAVDDDSSSPHAVASSGDTTAISVKIDTFLRGDIGASVLVRRTWELNASRCGMFAQPSRDRAAFATSTWFGWRGPGGPRALRDGDCCVSGRDQVCRGGGKRYLLERSHSRLLSERHPF